MCGLEEASGEINSMRLANCEALLGIFAMFEIRSKMV